RPDYVHLPARNDARRVGVLLQRALALQRDYVGAQSDRGGQKGGDQSPRSAGPVQVLDRQQRAVGQERERRSRPSQRGPARRLAQPMPALAITSPRATSPTTLRPTAR